MTPRSPSSLSALAAELRSPGEHTCLLAGIPTFPTQLLSLSRPYTPLATASTRPPSTDRLTSPRTTCTSPLHPCLYSTPPFPTPTCSPATSACPPPSSCTATASSSCTAPLVPCTKRSTLSRKSSSTSKSSFERRYALAGPSLLGPGVQRGTAPVATTQELRPQPPRRRSRRIHTSCQDRPAPPSPQRPREPASPTRV